MLTWFPVDWYREKKNLGTYYTLMTGRYAYYIDTVMVFDWREMPN